MMCAIIEDLLPASYFSTTLLGVQTDQRVLRHLIVQYLPRLDKLLQEHDIGETWLPPSPKVQGSQGGSANSELWGFEAAEPDGQAVGRGSCGLCCSCLLYADPFPSPPLCCSLGAGWLLPRMFSVGHSLVPAPVALVSVGRAVPDHTALVPDGLRQRGAHQTAAAHLGPVFLRGLPGVVPDDPGHAVPQGARSLLPTDLGHLASRLRTGERAPIQQPWDSLW